jgi:hypothetical protein
MKFMFGQVVITTNCFDKCQAGNVNVFPLVRRHIKGDWGEIAAEDRKANEEALVTGARLFSAYVTPIGRIWIITDAVSLGARHTTTILLPDDY